MSGMYKITAIIANIVIIRAIIDASYTYVESSNTVEHNVPVTLSATRSPITSFNRNAVIVKAITQKEIGPRYSSLPALHF